MAPAEADQLQQRLLEAQRSEITEHVILGLLRRRVVGVDL
jgi:hypothetical protein